MIKKYSFRYNSYCLFQIEFFFRETENSNDKFFVLIFSVIIIYSPKSKMIKIGIIGGSGFYQLSELKDSSEKIVNTEFGAPSDKLVEGTIHGVPVVVLAR